MDAMLLRAVSEGLDGEHLEKASAMVKQHVDMWWIKWFNNPPAKVKPWRSVLKKDARPYRAKSRRYNEKARIFMKDLTKQLSAAGYIFLNNGAVTVSAMHPAPKPKAIGEYRLTMVYRAQRLLAVPSR